MEASNTKEMREALEKALVFVQAATFDVIHNGIIYEPAKVIADVQAALSAPSRNCDVGTPEEQYDRHDKYCRLQPTCRKCLRGDESPMCISCFANWAQRPYEAAAQEGNKS
jgi:hypothetical protein